MIKLTTTEEKYLKAIFLQSGESGSNLVVSTNAISQQLNTTAASVTDMLKKLSEKELIHYTPYKGVHLTNLGYKIAVLTIRKQRLWEYFLVAKLKFSWDQVQEIAEQLEHIDSEELIEKLDEFLGFPKYDPHGDPIPDAKGKFPKRNTIVLQNVEPGSKVKIAGVLVHSSDFLKYLERIDFLIGTEIMIHEIIPFDESLLVSVGNKEVIVNKSVTSNILVFSIEQ